MTDRDGPLFLGIDAGLTNVKSALFDADGTEVAIAVRQSPTIEPEPGNVERDLDVLWESVRATIRDVVADTAGAPEAIAGVGVAGHGHGLYVLDADGDPVRNGIASTDSRAADLVEEWNRTGQSAAMAEITGYEPFVADPLSLLGWLDRHEPDSYDRIDRVLFCKDYLKYRLTGAVTTDEMEASVFYNQDRRAYSEELFEVLDLEDCRDYLPEVVPSWNRAGEVTDRAAAETGLLAGTPVASGLHDIGATALGAGVHEPRQAMLIVGTWGQSIVVIDEPTDAESGGLTRRYLSEGWLRYAGNRSATTCVDWFVEKFGGEWRAEASKRGIEPFVVYNERVEDVPPGAEGLLFHPYLHGSTDRPAARAGFYGLRENHTGGHLLRAIYEGVAIAQAEALERVSSDTRIEKIRFGGGGSKSDVWCRIFTDVLDEEIALPAGEEVGARGAAISAAIAVGTYPDHETAVDRMVDMDRRYEPKPAVAETYDAIREIFIEALEVVDPVWKRLRALESDRRAE